MVFQILLVKSRLFRMVLPHDTKCVTSVIALYGFAPCVHGRCACIGGNRRCDFLGRMFPAIFRADNTLASSFRSFGCASSIKCRGLRTPWIWLGCNKFTSIHGYTTTYNGIITEFYGYLLPAMPVQALVCLSYDRSCVSVTSCPCILRFVVHHVRHSVQGFTLDAFRFLTFGT